MTDATKELIEVLKGSEIFNSGFIEKIEYGKSIEYNDEKADTILFNQDDPLKRISNSQIRGVWSENFTWGISKEVTRMSGLWKI